MERKRSFFVILAVLAMLVAACGGDDEGTDTTAGGEGTGGEGNTGEVSIAGAPTGIEGEAIQQVIDEQINANVDYTATYTGSDSFEQDVVIRIEGGDPPDVAIWPQPGAVVSQAEQGNLVALEDLGYDIADLEATFGEYLVSLGEVDGKHYGIPTNVNLKSTVWYNVHAFEAKGYETPSTWEELMALSDQIVADGGTPWCVGLGSEANTGWPATDWMEDIVLRQAGPDAYDGWVSHDVLFDSPEITAAAETFGEVLFTDGYVLGGASQTPSIDFRDAPDPMFSDRENPNCYMHRMATFITTFFDASTEAFPDGLTAVEDYNFFPFPSIDGNDGSMFAGEMAAVLNNRPEVLDFVQQFVSTDVQCAQGDIEGISRISPNVDVGADCYTDELIASAAGTLNEALNAGTARFDASDLMPPEVGSGTFWQGMIDFATGGPDNVQSVMQSIDAGWPSG